MSINPSSKNVQKVETKISRKVINYGECKNIEGILNSKLFPLYFQFLTDLKNDKIQGKVYDHLDARRKNHLSHWEKVYKETLINKNGLIPGIIFKYILAKAKRKYEDIVKEAQKFDMNISNLYDKYVKQCQRLRNKVVDQKKAMGIDLESNEYFKAKRNFQFRFITNLSKKLKSEINDASKPRISIRKIFNFSLINQPKEEKEEIITTSDEERNEMLANKEVEKVKSRIKEEKVKIENMKKRNTKYLYVKSRFLKNQADNANGNCTVRSSLRYNSQTPIRIMPCNDYKECNEPLKTEPNNHHKFTMPRRNPPLFEKQNLSTNLNAVSTQMNTNMNATLMNAISTQMNSTMAMTINAYNDKKTNRNVYLNGNKNRISEFELPRSKLSPGYKRRNRNKDANSKSVCDNLKAHCALPLINTPIGLKESPSNLKEELSVDKNFNSENVNVHVNNFNNDTKFDINPNLNLKPLKRLKKHSKSQINEYFHKSDFYFYSYK